MRPGKPIAIGLPLLLVAASMYSLLHHSAHSPAPVARPKSCTRLARPFTGVVVAPPQGPNLSAFSLASGVRPSVLEFYMVFGDRFDASRADIAEQSGAVPLMQWNPTHSSLSAIVDGRYDGYLKTFAAAARGFGCTLIVSFAHEMNRSWYTWGSGHESPATFVAAWRRIHGIFAAAGASNVIWAWDPNVGSSASSLQHWWPGSAYVNMVGLDGYYLTPKDTFRSVFAETLSAVRVIAPGVPVLIAETGAYPGLRMAGQITGLFAGAKAADLVGVVYFDISGLRDWRLDDDPAALAAFGKAVRGYAA